MVVYVFTLFFFVPLLVQCHPPDAAPNLRPLIIFMCSLPHISNSFLPWPLVGRTSPFGSLQPCLGGTATVPGGPSPAAAVWPLKSPTHIAGCSIFLAVASASTASHTLALSCISLQLWCSKYVTPTLKYWIVPSPELARSLTVAHNVPVWPPAF